MVDFALLNERLLASLTPEQMARRDERLAREARWEESSVEILATFERQETRPRPAPPEAAVSPARAPGASPFRRGGTMVGPRPSVVETRPGKQALETYVSEEWTRVIRMRIEEREWHDGSVKEVVRFYDPSTGRGPVTGHEAYTLDESLARMLSDPDDALARPRWYVCAGTAGSWHGCWVPREDVAAYLLERRPGLFADQSPAPGR
jgi:hypothetical protein